QSNEGMEAMSWFYEYSVANKYVKKAVLDKNTRFDSHGDTVTVNVAKPEFKNMKRAAAGNSLAGGYPSCTICH
ncbi:galactose-1-phosphate uridylyltransferase, partial [Bifidobacterium breve]|nr:galactose-1-phosphate uridylyltransferase [Bifidobacterium breve]